MCFTTTSHTLNIQQGTAYLSVRGPQIHNRPRYFLAWTCCRDVFGQNRLTAQPQSINRLYAYATLSGSNWDATSQSEVHFNELAGGDSLRISP